MPEDHNSYHPGFDAERVPACCLCGQYLLHVSTGTGTRTGTDTWCPAHEVCHFCAHPTLEHTDPAYCSTCRADVIEDETRARTLVEEVRQLLDEHGLVTDGARVSFSFLPNDVRGYLGLATTWLSQPGWRDETEVAIEVRAGLTRAEFMGVAGHELAHAWMSARRVHASDLVSEGVAQLIETWVLSEVAGDAAGFAVGRLVTHPDPLYGAGCRLAVQALSDHGWTSVANRLLQTGRLPR